MKERRTYLYWSPAHFACFWVIVMGTLLCHVWLAAGLLVALCKRALRPQAANLSRLVNTLTRHRTSLV